MIHHWNHKVATEVDRFIGRPYATLDPGAFGWLLTFNKRHELIDGCVATDSDAAAALLLESAIRLIVMEDQYVTDIRRSSAIVELSFSQGVMVGRVLEQLRHTALGGLDLFHVAPSTWQSHQRRIQAVERYKGVGIEVAMLRAKALIPNEMEKHTPKLQEGIASAYGIHEWWVTRTGGCCAPAV